MGRAGLGLVAEIDGFGEKGTPQTRFGAGSTYQVDAEFFQASVVHGDEQGRFAAAGEPAHVRAGDQAGRRAIAALQTGGLGHDEDGLVGGESPNRVLDGCEAGVFFAHHPAVALDWTASIFSAYLASKSTSTFTRSPTAADPITMCSIVKGISAIPNRVPSQ